jgi:hypothetical protein
VSRRHHEVYRAYDELTPSAPSTVRCDRRIALTSRASTRASPVAWANSAPVQVAGPLGESLTANARALALVNMAVSDASVASFAAKYHYTFWRPETSIHAGDVNGNNKTSADPFYVRTLYQVSATCRTREPEQCGARGAREPVWRGGPRHHVLSAAAPEVTPHTPFEAAHTTSTMREFTEDSLPPDQKPRLPASWSDIWRRAFQLQAVHP